jgi:hypothetical protein
MRYGESLKAMHDPGWLPRCEQEIVLALSHRIFLGEPRAALAVTVGAPQRTLSEVERAKYRTW